MYVTSGSQFSASTWNTRIELRLPGLHGMHFYWLSHLADLRLDSCMQRGTGDTLMPEKRDAWGHLWKWLG